jgi:hypothetical protein
LIDDLMIIGANLDTNPLLRLFLLIFLNGSHKKDLKEGDANPLLLT